VDGGGDVTEPVSDAAADSADATDATDATDADDNTEVWVPVDLHVHTDGCEPREYTPLELRDRMEAAGIQVAAALLWGANWSRNRALVTGVDHPVSSATQIVHYDVEISGFQAATGGHLLLLGLPPQAAPEIWEDPYAYPGGSGVPILENEFGRLAALRGMAHGWSWPADGRFPAPPLDCCAALELPVHVARGTIDFVSTEYDFEDDPVYGSLTVWERLLQTGFKLPLVAASDWSCLRGRVGEMRSWVLSSGALSYSAVLEAVKLGRVVAVADESGRWLDMRIGGARLGDTIDVIAGVPMDVDLRVDQPDAGPVQLIANGQIVHEGVVPAGRSALRVPLAFSQSAWIRARIQKATTSPIYVTVGGAPIRPSADAACYFVRYMDHLTALVTSGEVDVGADRDAALRAYADARSVFMTRFSEAQGDQCP